MNEPDLGRLVTDWLRADAPPRAPDRVLTVALDRVHWVGQERPLGGRRFDGWIRRSPRLGWAIVGVVLAAALLGAIGVGAWLVQHEPRPNLNLVPPVVPAGVSNGWVAFAAGATTRQGDSDIYMAKAGLAERRIGGPGVLREVCPSFSPDGTRLAYSERPATDNGGNSAVPGAVVIVTLDEAGLPVGPVLRLPAPASSEGDVCPKWAPDGQSVAFLPEGQGPQLWIAHLDGTETQVAAGSPPVSVDGFPGQFDWSPDGMALVVVGDLSTRLWIVPLDGSQPRLLSRAGPTGDFEYPLWSPDGTRIAVLANTFVNYPDGSRTAVGSSVEVYRADGSGSPIDLANAEIFSTSFAWSPDGHRIAYLRGTDIVSVAPGTNDVRLITSDPRTIRGLIWSPDGMRLLYVADDGPSRLGELVSVAAVGDPAPIVLTQQEHDLEYTSSDGISWQSVLP